MKRTFIILFSCFEFVLAKAQIFSVGDSSCNYVILNQIINVKTPPGCFPYSFNTTTSLDIDGDLANDLMFTWQRAGAPCGSSWYSEGTLQCTSPNGYEVASQSITGTCASPKQVVNLPITTPLNTSLTWSVNPPNGEVYRYRAAYFSPYACGSYPGPPNYNTTMVYIGFRKILSGDTIYGWIKLYTGLPTGEDKVVSYAYTHTNLLSNPMFTNTTNTLCAGAVLTLSASPSGGMFNGPGVVGNTFTFSAPGSYSVYYTNGCVNAATLNINVLPLPNPAFTTSTSTICNGDSLVLSASPAGGVFSGPGVSGNVFNSSVTGPGLITVYYSYTDANSCVNNAIKFISVDLPTINVGSSSTISCPGEPVTLNATGANTYTWSTSIISPSCVVNPSTNTSYTVIGTSNAGCTNTAVFNQSVGNPTVTAVSNVSLICIGQTAILSASGASSYTWSTGSTTPTNNPVTPSVTTTYSVVGSATGGCADTAYVVVNIIPTQTLNVVSSNSLICSGDTVTIHVSNSNGFIIEGGTIWFMTAGSSINLNLSSTTTFTVTSTNSITGCSDKGYFTQNVSSCVGIDELNGKENYFNIFPNPNNGEFEIKGLKSETIFISNELGQLIAKKHLNNENNYSVKLNDLQSGVYFVGNKFSRQKVVVIK